MSKSSFDKNLQLTASNSSKCYGLKTVEACIIAFPRMAKNQKFISDIFTVKSIPKLFWTSTKTYTLRPNPISFVMLVIGLAMFGLGEAFLIAAGVGVSPWTVLAQGVSEKSWLVRRHLHFFY